jgi:hypothetical protein
MIQKYPRGVITQVKKLRSLGHTYPEINNRLDRNIPKSTLSHWCKNTPLPKSYQKKLKNITINNIKKAQKKAVLANKAKRKKFLLSLREGNKNIAREIKNKKTAKIALSILCLGEASKYSSKSRCFTLGSSDPRIIVIFLKLLKYCYDDFDQDKIRCTIQCRANQNQEKLKKFWKSIVKLPDSSFYQTRVDPRSKGKKTKKTDYRGVLRIDYLSSRTQLDLESLAELIFEGLSLGP